MPTDSRAARMANGRDIDADAHGWLQEENVVATGEFNLNSSFRFTNSCYISRRGAERQSLQSLSPLLEYVFVFTNWVKELSEILLVMVFFSVKHLNFLCALRLSALLRETFNRGF